MKYLFGDSSELPIQIDFLRLLNNYIETSVKVITLENTVFDLKETIMDRRRLKNSVLDEMDQFLMTVENAIFGAVAKSKEQETIVKYADKSKLFLKKFIEDGKTQFSDELFREIAQYEKKVDDVDDENRTILEAFFIQDPLPITNKKYTLSALEKGYSSKVQIDCEGNIACVFDIRSSELPFWKKHVKSRDFVRNVEIPAKMKKPFLKKELVPDIAEIDEYILTDLVLSGNEIEVVFRKGFNSASERFRMKMVFTGEFSVEVLHADEGDVEKNINAIPELSNELNNLRLRELGEKIIEKTNDLYIKKHSLKNIYIGGIDVLEENRIFELMQKVAEIFAPAVADIKKHSPSKEELSLKAEDESGKRSEIYLKISEVRGKLDSIGEKGMKLFEILGLQQ